MVQFVFLIKRDATSKITSLKNWTKNGSHAQLLADDDKTNLGHNEHRDEPKFKMNKN